MTNLLGVIEDGAQITAIVDDAKPIIHVEVQGAGPKGDHGPPGVVDYSHVLNITAHTHEQAQATTVWAIQHDLGFYPSVTTVTYGNNHVIGEVKYTDENSLTIEFTVELSGFAYLS